MNWLCFAVIFLHIISAPIVIGGAVYFDSDKKAAELCIRLFFIPVFVKKLDYDNAVNAIDRAAEKVGKESEKKDSVFTITKKPLVRYLMRIGLALLGRIRIRRIDIESEIGAGDAAVSAVSAGFLKTVYADIRALFYCDGEEHIVPNYDEECLFIDFDGIISLCIGDIIYAAIKGIKFKKRSGNGNSGRSVYGNVISE